MNARSVAIALNRLLQRKDDEGFATVEESSSGKFVQFFGSAKQPLVLDLPSQTLTSDERARAEQLFAQHDSMTVRDDGIQVVFGADTDAAGEAAIRMFREVYLCPEDATLSVSDDAPGSAKEKYESVCDRCGKYGPGRKQWMFRPWWSTLLGAGTGREFICFRCLRVLRIYALIGMPLLLLILLAIIVASVWVLLTL